MKIIIELPREAEAKVVFREKEGVVVVDPRFTRPDVYQSVQYLTVCGDGGAARRYAVFVSGKTGKIRFEEVHDVPSAFDSSKEESSEPKEPVTDDA